ncbi:MAG: hypothetical protein ACR2KG_06640 [Nocardioidaceae bacterium]
MTRLVVHIGAAKTATTYIQSGLFANTDLLAKQGVYLPTSGRLEYNQKSICHHHLAWQFTDAERFRPDIGGWDALAKELKTVEAETVLISSEGFENMAANHALGRVMRERLAAISDDVTVVYVVRDQLSQINSLYGQKVKMLNTGMKSFEVYARRAIKTGLFDLNECFRPWYRTKQADFVAIPFTELRTEDPIRAVLSAGRIELSDEELVTGDDPVNASLGPIGIEAAKLLTKYLQGIDPEFSYKSDHARKLYRLASTMARRNGWCETGFWGWTPEEAARVAEQFAESNQTFAQAVWGTDWPMPLPIDKPEATAELLQLSADELADVQRYVTTMARKYVEFRTGRPAKPTRKKGQKRAGQPGKRNQPGGPKQPGRGNQQGRANQQAKLGQPGRPSQGGPNQGKPGQQRGPNQPAEPGQQGGRANQQGGRANQQGKPGQQQRPTQPAAAATPDEQAVPAEVIHGSEGIEAQNSDNSQAGSNGSSSNTSQPTANQQPPPATASTSVSSAPQPQPQPTTVATPKQDESRASTSQQDPAEQPPPKASEEDSFFDRIHW